VAFLSGVRRHLLEVVLLAVMTGLVAYFGSSLIPKTYTSEARVYVGSLTNANHDQQLAFENLAQTYAQLAGTTPILQNVIDALGLKDRTDQLAARLDIRAPTGLSIIRIGASAPTAEEAAAIANAAAAEVVKLGKPTDSATPATSFASVVQEARPPPTASSPRPLLNAIVAVACALVVGALLATALDRRKEQRIAFAPAPPEPSWPK